MNDRQFEIMLAELQGIHNELQKLVALKKDQQPSSEAITQIAREITRLGPETGKAIRARQKQIAQSRQVAKQVAAQVEVQGVTNTSAERVQIAPPDIPAVGGEE